MSEASETSTQFKRDLPRNIVIPPIRGEMVHLRPATVDDLPRLDQLDAFYGASKITGKDPDSERAVVHTWVRRSQAWEAGQTPRESGVGDPESRRTIAWAILTDADHDDDGSIDAATTGNVIGMIFLIDIDGWSRSARIQIILGKDYRGRGYSRDAMPRVMTYGFAPEPAGLGMHRIWVGVPEKNSRSVSVYQSLGFVPSGSSRDALWDAENNTYQDLIVMDTLADEYDPIRSLDAFGMHLIEDNPGVKEALSAREHSIAIRQNQVGTSDDVDTGEIPEHRVVESKVVAPEETSVNEPSAGTKSAAARADNHPGAADESNWPYGQNKRKSSKEAWWRTLGHGRKRETEGE